MQPGFIALVSAPQANRRFCSGKPAARGQRQAGQCWGHLSSPWGFLTSALRELALLEQELLESLWQCFGWQVPSLLEGKALAALHRRVECVGRKFLPYKPCVPTWALLVQIHPT